MTFDPKDKKYQVSEEFPPNKEDSWPYPMEKDGENIVHDLQESLYHCFWSIWNLKSF